MVLVTFILCLLTNVINIVSLSCRQENAHFLFILDCRRQIEEQWRFTQDTRLILKTSAHIWSKSFEYLTFSAESGVYDPDATFDGDLDIDQLKHKCTETFPIEDMLYQSKEKDFLMSFIFVSNFTQNATISDDILQTILVGLQENQMLNTFFLLESSERDLLPEHKFIHYFRSFQDANFEDFYSLICKCPNDKNTIRHSYANVQTSFYHLINGLTISNVDAGTLCAERYNSYLVSFESYEEINLITEMVENYTIDNEINKTLLHTGLKWGYQGIGLLMDSKNPFWLDNSFNYVEGKECFVLRFSGKGDTPKGLDYNFQPVECNEDQTSVIVICECHQQINNEEIFSHASLQESDFAFTNFDKLIDLLKGEFVFDFSVTISVEFQSCIINNNSSSDDLPSKICSEIVLNVLERDTLMHPSISVYFDHSLKRIGKFIYTKQRISVSNCTHYKQCQEKHLKPTSESYEGKLSILCAHDTGNTTNQESCKKYEIDSSILLDTVELHGESHYRCIKFMDSTYNEHLKDCNNFVCPKGFIKCPNSYCVFMHDINDGVPDCPFGEEEFVFNRLECFVSVTFLLSDVCINMGNGGTFNKTFVCRVPCPYGHSCLSSKSTNNKGETSIEYYTIHLPLYVVSDSILPIDFIIKLPAFGLIALDGCDCKRTNFDTSFKFWRLSELLWLDLSNNNLITSEEMTLFSKLEKLLFLNLSFNMNLNIDGDFKFPELLETIDLSHTKISALGDQCFQRLTNLKHLNLSFTQIIRFKDMGIPEYFILESLYIQGLHMSVIQIDFFKGLTIESGVWTSDYKLCCPQILNKNISANKCHSPMDVISSCKHLVGDVIKRVVIWIVGLFTLSGNGVVLAYTLVFNRQVLKKAYGLFVTGLAVSDFLMGIYLTIIASVDIYFQDVYVLEEIEWKKGFVCALSGFLSTFSSETSTFFISLITVERFLCLAYPFGEYRFSKFSTWMSFALSWMTSCILALVPVIVSDWKIYSSNGLCLALPFSSTLTKGWQFSFIIFIGLNFVLFLLIAFGQVAIFASITRNRVAGSNNLKLKSKRRSEDLTVAKKLAMVAITDFLCWFPIGIIGLLSLK
ncbi:G-protein coupled receptor GRL101, partial [Biomphalaria glabrata]